MNDSETVSNPVGTLYVVGTPIGNLEDMTFRAVRILQTVDAIAIQNSSARSEYLKELVVMLVRFMKEARHPLLLNHFYQCNVLF
jgi:16S rRNA C1402 (ribose-2'-O) methylase RsmI